MAFGALKGTLTGSGLSVLNPSVASGSVVVAVGDLVVAVMCEQTALTVTAVTDNLGNSYTAQNAGTDAGNDTGRMFYSRVTFAGTLTTLNFAATASNDNFTVVGAVYEGPFTSPPIDANPANVSNDITTPYTGPSTGTLAQAVELVIAWMAGGILTVNDWSGGATVTVDKQSNDGAVTNALIASKVTAATTAVIPAFTGTAPSAADVLGTASFKQAAAALPEGWLTDSDAPKVSKALKVAALAAILVTDPVLPPLSIKSSVAQASSSQVAVNSWSVYDPTTGPVSPPIAAAAAPPVVLPDDTTFRRQRRKSLSDEIAAPVAPRTVSIAFIPHDSAIPRLAKKIVSSDITAPVGVAPGQFLVNFASQWAEHASISRRKPIRAAGASSTVEPITRSVSAAITSTIASASSGAIAVNSWSVYDPTTGPVLPPAPAVAARTLIDSHSDIRPLKRKIFLPLPTSVVIAIPVDDLWFESLDVPLRIKAKGRLTETEAPVFTPPVTPTVVVSAHWLVQSEPTRIKAKGRLTDVEVFPPPPVAAPPVVLYDPTVFRGLRQKGAFDPTTAPTFPPAAPTIVTVSHWLGQSEPSRIKWNKAAAASATIEAIQAPPSATIGTTFVGSSSSQIVIHGWSIYDATTGPVLPMVAPTPPVTTEEGGPWPVHKYNRDGFYYKYGWKPWQLVKGKKKRKLLEELEELEQRLREIAIAEPKPIEAPPAPPAVYSGPLTEGLFEPSRSEISTAISRAKAELEYQQLLKRQQDEDEDDEAAMLLLM